MANDKKTKSICIIRSNPVRPDSRVEKEAWTLKSAGYDVHILAWDRDTDAYETDSTITVGDTEIPITRLGHKASYGDGFKNIKSYLKFQFHMRKWLKKHRFDIIHACDFDTAFFSQGKAKKNQRFVFDIFDFICGDTRNFFGKCVKKAQLLIIDRADATIICTEDRKKQISDSNPKRLAVIHNAPSTVQVGNGEFCINDTGKIKIVYVGILQDFRLLKEVAEAISELPDVEFHIGGFGKYEDYFEQMSRRFPNIIYYGKLSYDKALMLEKECDIMLAIYDPLIENHRFAAPNKFYESLMLGKPVVMVRDTGMSEIIEKNNLGVLIEYSKESFVDGLKRLIEQKDSWEEMSKRMNAIYHNEYSWDKMAERLLKLYDNLSFDI